MALNFPNNPQINEEYISGTTTWAWDGLVWRVRPIENVATVDQVSAIFATPATTDTLGTVKVDGTTILIDAEGVISSVGGDGGGGGGDGVDLTAFSVDLATPGLSTLTYNNVTGVFTYTPPDLSGYLTSYTEVDTLNSVTTRGSTTDNSVTINNVLSASSLTVSTTAVVTGNLTTLANLTVGDTLYTTNIINVTTGVPRFQSGTDFIIDAVGDVNVSGSKIRNLAAPLIASDAANKAYVDGAASAFNGGTVSGVTNFTSTQASTSVDTGAVTIDGGLGVNGDSYFGGLIYINGSPALTSASGGFNGGIISGSLFVNNNTISTNTATGALRVQGGVGIVGTVNIGPDAFINAIKLGRGQGAGVGSTSNLLVGGGTGNDAPLALIATGSSGNTAIGFNTLSSITTAINNTALGFAAAGGLVSGNYNVAIGAEAMHDAIAANYMIAIGNQALLQGGGDDSIAIGRDALKITNGIGNIAIGAVAGSELGLGNYNVIIGANTGITITGTDNNIILADGQGIIRAQWNSFGKLSHTGDIAVDSGTSSSSSSTGALVVTGGVGIGGAINVAGVVNVTNNTNASSVSTGAIIVAGGIGVSGTVYANSFNGDGSALTNITASSFAGGTVAGATNFTNTTPATSTATGAVRVSNGGLGVNGAVWANSFNGASIPTAGNVPGANGLVRTDGSGYAYVNYINSNTSAETLTLGNFIVTNNTDNFYRKYSLANVKTGLFATRNVAFGTQTTTLLTATGSQGGLECQGINSAAAAAFMAFHRPNRYASYFGLDTDNQFAVGGWSAGTALASMKMGSLGVGTTASGTAGEIRATNNITAFFSSDIKFKENVRDIPNALDKVVAIGGKLFSWTDAYLKDHGGEDEYFLPKESFGVIAQDVERVFPQATRKRADGSLAVDYEKLSALALAAIAELTKRVESLEKGR